MKRIAAFYCLCFLACGGLAIGATISIESSPVTVSPGQTFTLDVDVSSVTDLYAFQFDIAFNPSVLDAVDINEGAFLPSGGTTFFITGTIDNMGGTISSNADSLFGAISGVDGSGVLATVDFIAIAPGDSAINILNESLLDSNFDTISDTTQSGDVQVQGTPEPRALFLIAASVLVICWKSERSRSARFRSTIR
jgi:general secretion pathway protein D